MFEFNFKHYNPRNLIADLNLKSPKIVEGLLTPKVIFLSIIFFLVFSFSGLFYIFNLTPPSNFPVGVIVEIEDGDTLTGISEYLEQNNIIKSAFWFKVIVKVLKGDKGLMSGDYFFEYPKDSFGISHSLTSGNFGLNPIRITMYEGTSVSEMAEMLEKKFAEFDAEEFKKIAKEGNKEGYLFPDTYLFLPNVKAPEVIFAMEKNFYEKIKEIQDKIDKSEKDLNEIITMASLLEEEARTQKTRKIISGILWNRIDIGMPLQVDAVFPYIMGKNTYQVSLEDLKIDDPYNTYKNKGLPPGPITNPGLNSIIAALEPIESDYFYYLSDRQGNLYYAVDFEGHKRNRVLYLN